MGKAVAVLAFLAFCLPAAARTADFNGDGREDAYIFRDDDGLWAVRGITRAYFGGEGDIAVPGDYDGSGAARPAIFRPSAGLWAVRGLTRAYFGLSGDQPEPADYGGDGTDDFAIFRPDGGLWAARETTRTYFGGEGDTPVPGVYDFTGVTRPAIFRSSSGLWAAPGAGRLYFGGGSDTPVPGDYDGAGIHRPAIFRPSEGLWAVWDLTRIYFGRSGDQAEPEDHTGNGKDNFRIFRPANGLWAVRGVTRFYFGGTETPQPTPAVQWRDGYDLGTLQAQGGKVEFWTQNILKPTEPNTPGAPHEYIITRVTGQGFSRLLIMTMYERPARIYLDDQIWDNRFEQPLPGPSHWRVSSDGSRMWIELDGTKIWEAKGNYHIESAVMGGYRDRGFLGEWYSTY